MPIYVPFHNRKEYPPVYPPVYHHRGRWPPPEPKPALHRSTYAVGVSHSHHRRLGHKEERSGSHGRKRRYVRFADQPTIIELPTSPPQNPSSAPVPTRARLRCPSRTPAAGFPPPPAPTPPNSYPAATARQEPPAPARSRPHHSGSAATATLGLHDLLASFPPGLWDLRHNARPTYHPQHQPRYAEPVFSPDRRKRSITLYFRPCDRPELSWTAIVKAANCGKHLTVGDVLGAISTELFRRSPVCRELCESHPCYAKARSAHRIRTRRGHTQRPHYDDAFRNVDLFHADHGQELYFEGLRPERLRDGEVVYLVKFSCA